MPELVAFAAVGSSSFVETIERIWDAGDAFCPYDPRLPRPAVERLFEAVAPTVVLGPDGARHRRPEGRPVAPGDALVVPTSGSTGTPKGVVHTHDSIVASAEATSSGLGVRPGSDRWLCCLPLAHVAGLSVVFRARHYAMDLEVLPHFDAKEVTAAAVERGATLTTVVPTALARFDPLLYRRIVVGGAAPPTSLPPNAVTSYGLTETGSAIAYDGRALPGVELRVIDGEVQIRGAMLLRAYRNADGDTHPLDTNGWFATGDAGCMGDDGLLEVFGRRDELIITGGENVWPTAVEAVLARHPDVAEVAVVGRPDPEWGHRVVAVVAPVDASRPPTLDALRDWVKAELAPWAAPRELELRDSLPRIGIGKVDRIALR